MADALEVQKLQTKLDERDAKLEELQKEALTDTDAISMSFRRRHNVFLMYFGILTQ